MEPLNDDFGNLAIYSEIEQKEVTFLLAHKVQILAKLEARRDLHAIAAKAFRYLTRPGDKDKPLDDINFAIISFQINKRSFGLDCSKCMITRIPKTLFTEALAEFWERLEGLYLRNNHIAWLPEEMSRLRNLKNLDLSYNCLKQFPEPITTIETLRDLILRGNELTGISPNICRLGSLMRLHCDTNQIESIPPSIGRLPEVVDLDLSRNQLGTLPEEISHMQSLARLWLNQNPLEHIPSQIIYKRGLFIAMSDCTPKPKQVRSPPPPQPLEVEPDLQQDRAPLLHATTSGCILL